MMSDISILGLLKGDSLLSMENGLVLFSFFFINQMVSENEERWIFVLWNFIGIDKEMSIRWMWLCYYILLSVINDFTIIVKLIR